MNEDIVEDKYKGGTLLHQASGEGNAELARLLIESGADINVQTIDGDIPMDFAAEGGHDEMLQLLLLQAGSQQ